MQSHTRKHPRIDLTEGPVARHKREHAEQRRKFWLALAPVGFVIVLLLVAFQLGVIAK